MAGFANAAPPEVWMAHYYPQKLTTEGLKWDFTRRNLDGMEFYINAIAYLIPEPELATFAADLKTAGIKIGIEGGYFDWEPKSLDFNQPNPRGITEQVRPGIEPGVGAKCAGEEMLKLTSLINSYGPPDYMVLDGPIRRLMHPGADTGRMTPDGDIKGLWLISEVGDELVGYMRAWREKYPQVQFILITNFPNWGWKGEMAYWGSGPGGMFWGDYYPLIRSVLRRLEAEGLRPAGVRADSPYEHTKGEYNIYGTPWPEPIKNPASVDWMSRLLDLERFVKSQGVKFDIVLNSDLGGNTSAQAFSERSLEFLNWYQASGGQADRYIVQSWYKYPEKDGPEDEPYTLTHLTAEFLRRLKPQVD